MRIWVVTEELAFIFYAYDAFSRFTVTEVQTCALPIIASTRQSPQETVAVTARLSTLRSERALPSLRQAPARAFQFDPRSRSEVRRVGKEDSSRALRYEHAKDVVI